MDTRSRKQRLWRQREDLFLDHARELLLTAGYHGLTMDRIAQATGYSRGTIYQHFRCKEDMIATLVHRGMERRLDMIERSAAFQGRTRERMQAVGVAVDLFVRLYPDDARLLQLGNVHAVIQKASETALFTMRSCVRRSMDIATGIVREAVAQGDLVLDEHTPPEEITFNLWAITEGGHGVASSWPPPAELGIQDPFDVVTRGCERLCDGYGWRPLTSEWDYEKTRQRIREELFPEEIRNVANI